MTRLVLATCLLAAAVAAAAPAEPTVFGAVADPYLQIQAALAADSVEGVSAAAGLIAAAAAVDAEAAAPTAAELGVAAENLDAARALLPAIAAAASAQAKAADLKAARAAFVALSESVIALRDLAQGERPVVAYCPMAKHEWLQAAGAVANPYYGSGMLRCGSIVRK